MNDQKPTVVLVHGAFAESASWNGVIERLQAQGSIRWPSPIRFAASRSTRPTCAT